MMDTAGSSRAITRRGYPRLWRWILPCAAVLGCSIVRGPEQTAFSVGRAQRLSVRVESEVKGGIGLSPGLSSKRYSLRGTAALLPLSASTSEVRLRLQLEDLKLQATSEDEQAALSRLVPVLGEPVVFTLTGGSVRNLQVSPRMQVQAYGWLRAVVSALQWPEQVSAGGLQVEEEDATGRYQARVERTATGLRKTKARYLSIFSQGVGAAPHGLTPEIVRSEHTRSPTLGPLSRVTVDEAIKMPLSEGKTLEVATRVWLTALPSEASAALTPEQLRTTERALTGLAVFSPPTPREGAFDAERIGGATLQQVLAEIDRLRPVAGVDAGAQGEATDAYLERFSLIVALLRQRPSEVEHAGDLVRSGYAQSSLLLQALSSAGTEPAQALLRGFALGEGVSEQVRSLAATSLLRVQQPAEPTVELLTRWADDPAMDEHGLYGLGTAARHLRERGQPQRAQAIANLLGEELRKAKTAPRVELVLRGIANSADAQLFEPVRARAADADPGIRTAALDALRFMDHPRVDAVLLERARLEQDVAAQRALLSTLSARKPSDELAKAVAELTASRQRYGVRFAAVEQAGQWLAERPELRALLEQVSRNDARQEVRVLALGLLKPVGKDTP
jgi:hypothetical protein